MASMLVLLVVLALTTYLQAVSAIKCYECSSSDNRYCADPPDTNNLQPVDCGAASVCSKEVLTIFDRTVVSRWCADENFCKNVDESIGTCSLCITDRCNSSTFIKSSLLVVATSLVLVATRRIFAA
uniref:Putative 13.7 kDa midgut protein n=1 Tax=Nyssomyia neivai TaxID=330878 RepID=A0A1L8D728_9DIPT